MASFTMPKREPPSMPIWNQAWIHMTISGARIGCAEKQCTSRDRDRLSTAASRKLRFAIKSASTPTSRRNGPSLTPAAWRASAPIPACVILAGCAIKLSIPPGVSARVTM